MKRVIITGATGVLGIALIKELIEKNIEMLVVCRADSKRNRYIPESPLVQKIYCDLDSLSMLQNDTDREYDVFYHFAWNGTINPYRNDMHLQNQNVKYALDAVDCAKRFGCKMFIGAGSQAEYGRFEGLLEPTTPVFPEMGYGYAKLCAGQMTRDYAHQLGLEHIWTRILSVYGPNDGAQSMIMFVINKLLAGEIPRLTKGEQLWDYLYSGDAANAFYLLGEKGIDSKTYVLGSGSAMPLREYICTLRDCINPNFSLGFGEIPYGEKQVMHLQADISELQYDTGWSPRISFLEGIQKTIQWIKEEKE